jgi:hypothetical protein
MSFDSSKGICVCERCGHGWKVNDRNRTADNRYLVPKRCSKCKNKGWNTPRVYANTKNFTGIPFAKRQKSTWKK